MSLRTLGCDELSSFAIPPSSSIKNDKPQSISHSKLITLIPWAVGRLSLSLVTLLLSQQLMLLLPSDLEHEPVPAPLPLVQSGVRAF